MDASAVRKIVEQNIHWMRWACGLSGWTVDVAVKPLKGNTVGLCTAEPGYGRAAIDLDPAGHDSAEDVLWSLRHELMHILHIEFCEVGEMVREAVSQEAWNILSPAWARARESMVTAAERMLDNGLGLSPKAMMTAAKRHATRIGKDRERCLGAMITAKVADD